MALIALEAFRGSHQGGILPSVSDDRGTLWNVYGSTKHRIRHDAINLPKRAAQYLQARKDSFTQQLSGSDEPWLQNMYDLHAVLGNRIS